MYVYFKKYDNMTKILAILGSGDENKLLSKK